MAIVAVIPINAPVSHQNARQQPRVSPVDAFLGRLAANSCRGFRIALNNIARIVSEGKSDADSLDWASLRYEDTTAIRSALVKQYSVRTANYGLSALRSVLKEAWRLGMMSHADYARATDLPQVRGDDMPSGRVLSDEELTALFMVCHADPSPAGTRDAAIVALMYNTGIRRAEVVGLKLADYSDGVVNVRTKGNKVLTTYVLGEARNLLERWLELRGNADGALFVPVSKTGRLGTKPISTESLQGILRRRSEQANIPDFTCHDLRRTCATHLLSKGVDVFTVQKLLGHRWVTTTQVYDKRGEDSKRKAASVLQMPTHN
jgi:integrase/recombinase XerD